MGHDELRRGDLVEVRSPGEILATLDEEGTLGGLLFMPEMAAYCGRRFTVEARAEKLCDTIECTSRRLPASVLLEDLRCDGSLHDGCQAACRLLWKEAWLKTVTPDAPPAPPAAEQDMAALIDRTSRNVRRIELVDGKDLVRYRCQATDITQCTVHLNTFDPRPYVRELTCGNVSLARFVRVTTRAAIEEPMLIVRRIRVGHAGVRMLRLLPDVHLPGTAKKGDEFPALDLQVGEKVRIKSREEIARTLRPDGYNKGLRFDREMLPFCGKVSRVRSRMSRFVDDRNGKMIVLKTAAVTLDGVVCSGDLSRRRWFCPRAIYSYWRECWLERVEPAFASVPATPQAERPAAAPGGPKGLKYPTGAE
jgi:hypothetical protein